MNKVIKSWIFPLAIMGMLLMIISGCQKKADNSNTPPTWITSSHPPNIWHRNASRHKITIVDHEKNILK